MSRIDANELPTPEGPQWGPQQWGQPPATGYPAYPPAQPTYVPMAPAAQPAAKRNFALIVTGGVVALAIGAFALLNRDDNNTVASPGSTLSTPANGNGGNGNGGSDGNGGSSTVSVAQVGSVYQEVFGMVGASSTIECVAAQVGAQGGQAVRLVSGELLNYDQTLEAFVPFVTCAPDNDFVNRVGPATVQVLGGSADEACIADNLAAFGVADRAIALTEVWILVDEGQHAAKLYDFFLPCAI